MVPHTTGTLVAHSSRTRTTMYRMAWVIVGAVAVVSCGSGSTNSYPDAADPGATGGSTSVGSGGSTSTGSGGSTSTGSGGSTPVSTGGAGGAAPPVAIADFGTVAIQASCAFAARCAYVPDAASCMATTWVDSGTLTLQADVAAGRVTYDAAKAGACLDAARNTPCTYAAQVARRVGASPCDGVFTGTVATGGTCLSSDECAAKGVCVLAAGTTCTTACCMGTCMAPAAAGASCLSTSCVDGTYCRSQTNRCVAQQASEGGVCDAGDGCKPPLFCIPDGTGSGTCGRSLPQTGGACDPTVGCDNLGDYCNSAGACAKLVGIGQPCIAATTTAPDNCVIYGYCSAGVCKAFGAAGAVCISDTTGASDCQGNLTCPATTAVCTAPPAAMSCR